MSDNDLRPGGVYWSVIDPVWDSISIYDGPDTFLRQFCLIRQEVGHLFAAHWCQSEVCNGGFHQFFFNSTGVLAPEALEAFRAIELTEWAAILAEAMGFFGEPYPRERNARRNLLPVIPGRPRDEWDPFGSLDNRFYEWLDAGADRWKCAADAYARRFAAPE